MVIPPEFRYFHGNSNCIVSYFRGGGIINDNLFTYKLQIMVNYFKMFLFCVIFHNKFSSISGTTAQQDSGTLV